MIATLLLLAQMGAMPPEPRLQCTPALTARAEPKGWRGGAAVRDGGTLALGRAGSVTLAPDTRFAVAPEKAPPAGTRGASVGFVVPRAGHWRVSLDSAVWIDVVHDGRAVASIAHGHGAPCSGVRKQVDFDLAPGRYVLQLSGATVGIVRAMVSPA